MSDTLFQAEDNKNICTLAEAYEKKIPISFYADEPDKPTTKCEYCGAVLHYECVILGRKVVSIRNEPQRCTCEQAAEYWRKADEERRLKEEKEKREEEEAALSERIKVSGISKRYTACRLDSYICNSEMQKKAITTAQDYCNNFLKRRAAGEGLYIEGTIGTGKTHLAAAICYEVMKQGKQALFTTSNDLLLKIQSTYNNNRLSTDEVIQEYKTVSLLVIDDLGKEKPTEWALSMLFNIIDHRYRAMLPIIITTNYNESELINRLTLNGDNTTIKSIIDRLHQNTELITITGKSYR